MLEPIQRLPCIHSHWNETIYYILIFFKVTNTTNDFALQEFPELFWETHSEKDIHVHAFFIFKVTLTQATSLEDIY